VDINELDTSKRYTAMDYEGIALVFLGPELTAFNDPVLACCDRDAADCDCASPDTEGLTGMARMRMVGDDREHLVDPHDIAELGEDDYCAGCGQVGCGHG
jgi:hypothetical protein